MVNILKEHIREYFVGKDDTVENLLICLLAGGHVLLEGVPGVGKTTLAETLARAVDCDYGRIQFTPDTLPTDVMGTYPLPEAQMDRFMMKLTIGYPDEAFLLMKSIF